MTSAPATRPLYAKLERRVALSVALIIILAIPAAAMLALTGEVAALNSMMAGIAGVVALAVGGLEVAVMTSFVMALITPVSIIAGGSPVTGAALMALMCLTVGRLSRFGLHSATLLVPVFMAWTLIDPPGWGPADAVDRTDSTYLTWMAVFYFVGAIVPVLVLAFPLRKFNLPAPKPHGRRESIPYTATITVLASVSTYIVLQHPKDFAGAWLITTILVLAHIGDVGTVDRTIQRVGGTLLGSLVVLIVVLRVESLPLIYLIGLVFAVAALTARFSPHYWLYMALITPTAVCLNAYSPGEVSDLGIQRALDTVVGAVLVLMAAALTAGYAHLEHRRGHEPTTTEPVVMGKPQTAAG